MDLKITEVTSFPTLFLGFDLRGKYDPDEIVKDAREEVLPHGVINSPNEDDGSSYGTTGFLDTRLELRSLMQECVDAYVHKIQLEDLGIWNSWINVGGPGSKTELHRHEGSVLSGSFYPKIVGNKQDSPPLILHSPLKPFHMTSVFKTSNNYNTYYQEVPAWEGLLWIFPSWCEHSTVESKAKERYCISFNTYPRKFDNIKQYDKM